MPKKVSRRCVGYDNSGNGTANQKFSLNRAYSGQNEATAGGLCPPLLIQTEPAPAFAVFEGWEPRTSPERIANRQPPVENLGVLQVFGREAAMRIVQDEV